MKISDTSQKDLDNIAMQSIRRLIEALEAGEPDIFDYATGAHIEEWNDLNEDAG